MFGAGEKKKDPLDSSGGRKPNPKGPRGQALWGGVERR